MEELKMHESLQSSSLKSSLRSHKFSLRSKEFKSQSFPSKYWKIEGEEI